MKLPKINLTLKIKLYIFIIALLVFSCLIVGVPSYNIAKIGLNKKGEIILKNSVKAAIELIDAKNRQVVSGNISLAQAQEDVKQYLIGKRNADGTRQMENHINLGENGYFIVYSLKGIEIMHPNLEGKNVWSIKDYSNNPYLLVQDQIKKGENGGGYSYYEWKLPNSDKIDKKVSYSEIDTHWNWIVVASSYMKAYNSEASKIMIVILCASFILLLLGGFVSYNFIHGITTPLRLIMLGMKETENGNYVPINNYRKNDEMGTLLKGFNRMVSSVNTAYEKLMSQEKKAHSYAYYDQLTGMPNQNLFRELITSRIDEYGVQGYIILAQTKDFESIVSLFGDEYGENLIKFLGKTMMKNKQEDMIFARISTNEFAAWVENSTEAELMFRLIITKALILESLEKEGFGRLNDFFLSYSAYPEDDNNFDGCMQKAKIAMQFAKYNSIYNPVGFKSEFFTKMENEARMLALAELDMERDKFSLHYQGKWCLDENSFCGVEALARWFSEELGSISPNVFIPVLTKANLMSRFSEYILEKALDDYPKIEAQYGVGTTLSINIPHDFFYKDDFVKYIEGQINKRGINPRNIILEITEDTLIESVEQVQEITSQLRTIGIQVSLDDFGTGYSSLNYLLNIQFDEIKIDKSFIDNLQKDEKHLSLFTHIVQIARTFNASVVAEGVERADQIELIQPTGCCIIQGYLYSMPKALD